MFFLRTTILGLGAYGAHSLAAQEVTQDRLKAFEVANRWMIMKVYCSTFLTFFAPTSRFILYFYPRYHLIHSAALLAMPLASKPRLSGSLMLGGMALFCGTCYYHALTGEDYWGELSVMLWVFILHFFMSWLSMSHAAFVIVLSEWKCDFNQHFMA